VAGVPGTGATAKRQGGIAVCRLIGWVCARPRTLAQLVGDERIDALVADVSRLHPDGWGAALSDLHGAGSDLRVERSTEGALRDPGFVSVARSVPAQSAILHLRRATAGYAVEPRNTHPFVLDGWAFAHNGTIPEAERIDGLLGGQWRAHRAGTTDSERYFLCVLERVEKEGSLVDGVRAAVAEIRAECGFGSMNAMLLGPEVLAVVHARAGTVPPVDILLQTVGGDVTRLPPEHTDQYYDLRYRSSPDSVVISSTGMPDASWTPLAEESVLVADRTTGDVSVWPLAGGAATSTVHRVGWPAP
jgi:predicted glutamine amidotransferase